MKRPLTSMFLFAAVALLLVAAGSYFAVCRATERTEIRNLSGQTITNVVLVLHDYQTDWSVTNRTASLNPGESLCVRHTHRDTKAVVEFTMAGRSFHHEEGYIDLWTGEGWRFEIQPDGTVTSGSDYAKKD